jgi:hypothetical protein
MTGRMLALPSVALLVACASAPAPIQEFDLARLQGSPEIPVVHRASPAPVVDCPGNEGERIWTLPGTERDRPPPLVLPASAQGGNIWQQFSNQYTESLRRSPPADPAGATGGAFAAAAAGTPAQLPFQPVAAPIDSAAADALLARFGGAPVLLFETTRFVLVGCFYKYQPWFSVRATLLDPSGAVLWRDACGGLYPPIDYAASAPDLEANGKELYTRLLDYRARGCAQDLVKSFARSMRGRTAVQ